MYKTSIVRHASVLVILAITSTSLLAQSGRFREKKTISNDLSRKEKNLRKTSRAEDETRDETASPDRKPQSTQTKPIQKQQLTDEEVVSIIIVTALVLIVFVGLRRT